MNIERQAVEQRTIATGRLTMALRVAGTEGGIPVVLIHGNVASSRFFEETMAVLPRLYHLIAPDLRGFGASERAPVDATRGLGDFVEDIRSLVEALDLEETPIHLLGWSLGGGVAMGYTLAHPAHVASLTLLAPVSPHGYGGSRGEEGAPVCDDYAGSGGGVANPEFVQRLTDSDEGDASAVSPRNVLNQFYFKPPFALDEAWEDELVAAMNRTATGPDNYPGDSVASPNWPGVAPGERGVLNALSPKHLDLSPLVEIDPGPPILWLRGADDQIVSDTSLFDLGYLGQIGAVPGWPGAEHFPPQPMVAQTRAVLERYAAGGGRYEEEVIDDCGHAPHIEQPEAFLEYFTRFLRRHS